MKFLELTQYKHDSTQQDYRILINPEHVVSITPFKYNNGDIVTTLNTERGIYEVTEDYDTVKNAIETGKL